MGNYIIPGPLCVTRSKPIDKGTLNLQPSPPVGPVGMATVHVVAKRREIKEFSEGVFGTRYQATILEQQVLVRVAGRSEDAVYKVSQKLDAAIDLINRNCRQLSKEQKAAIQAIKELLSDFSQHSGVIQRRRLFNITDKFINESSTAWLAASIAHDGVHIIQWERGETYDRQTAAKLEKEANAMMLSLAGIFGLTPEEVKNIKADKHTAYNVGFY